MHLKKPLDIWFSVRKLLWHSDGVIRKSTIWQLGSSASNLFFRKGFGVKNYCGVAIRALKVRSHREACLIRIAAI